MTPETLTLFRVLIENQLALMAQLQVGDGAMHAAERHRLQAALGEVEAALAGPPPPAAGVDVLREIVERMRPYEGDPNAGRFFDSDSERLDLSREEFEGLRELLALVEGKSAGETPTGE